MCLGLAGQIVGFSDEHPDLADVDVAGVVRDINVGMLNDAPLAAGDWVMIHMGFAMERMSAVEAEASVRFLEGQARHDESLALSGYSPESSDDLWPDEPPQKG